MRGAILDTILTKYNKINELVRYAEDYTDWNEHGTVKNLIDFELAIADMAGAIVLILEGPGAYTELGSFSVLDSLAEKLILVVNNNIIDEETFINYGPIKYLEDNNKVVLKYNWDVKYTVTGFKCNKIDSKVTLNKEDTLELSERITDRVVREFYNIVVKSPVLNPTKIGHVCFIIGDLIYTFYALKLSEINSFLKDYFDVVSNYSLIRTCIYILERFEFVSSVDNGDKYYIATYKNLGFIKHVYQKDYNDVNECKSRNEIRDKILEVLMDEDADRLASYMGGE